MLRAKGERIESANKASIDKRLAEVKRTLDPQAKVIRVGEAR